MPAEFAVQTRARTEGGSALRCEIVAEMVAPFVDRWALEADEPLRQGGTASAPPPLHLLAGALAACLATQIRVFARNGGLRLDGLAVAADFRWSGHSRAGGRYAARAEGIDVEITVDSPAPAEAVAELAGAAITGCFVEALLDPALPVRHRLHHGGAVLDLPARVAA